MTENTKTNMTTAAAAILVIVAGYLVYNYCSKIDTTSTNDVGQISSKLLSTDFHAWVRVIEDNERGVICWISADGGIYCIPKNQLVKE